MFTYATKNDMKWKLNVFPTQYFKHLSLADSIQDNNDVTYVRITLTDAENIFLTVPLHTHRILKHQDN
jgi:hypothetical protein